VVAAAPEGAALVVVEEAEAVAAEAVDVRPLTDD
jgi:hypothetical protein